MFILVKILFFYIIGTRIVPGPGGIEAKRLRGEPIGSWKNVIGSGKAISL